MDQGTRVQNSIFWRTRIVSLTRITELKSGEMLDMDSSTILNPQFAPSPEEELIAMETVMSENIVFGDIANHNDSPLPMSQTAFKVLAEGCIEADLTAFETYLNEGGKLTVTEAKRFAADHPPKPAIPSILDVLNTAREEHPGFNPDAHIERNLAASNRLVTAILGAAYWVALMTRDNSAGIDNSPVIYDEAREAIGASTNYHAFFYNREKEDRDETRVGISASQWNVLEGNADRLVDMLADLQGCIDDGFEPDTDRKEAFNRIVEQQGKNQNTRALAAEATRSRQQAEARSATEAVATGLNF